jgi:hypothetical protein
VKPRADPLVDERVAGLVRVDAVFRSLCPRFDGPCHREMCAHRLGQRVVVRERPYWLTLVERDAPRPVESEEGDQPDERVAVDTPM